MWLFTTNGFLSVVRDADDPDRLVVRGRVREDLEAFCEDTGAPAPVETPGRDYRWRTWVSPATFATHLADQAGRIDYPNFKDAVASRQGHERAHRYHDVWQVMYDLQRTT
jgi:hypothetical protein